MTPTFHPEPRVFSIGLAAPADIPAVARVMGHAFADDTVMASLVRRGSRARSLETLFLAMLNSDALNRGIIDIARSNADGAIMGAAIWQRPGARDSLLRDLGELPLFVRALGPRGLLNAARLQRTLDRHRPAESHWYLAQIGTATSAQGTGVGTALLSHRLNVIDARAEPAYLESSNERNRKLYRRFGFATIGSINGVAGTDPARMWRLASSTRSASADHSRPR